MFVVDQILISDDLLETAFACDLGACKGACCVHGDLGAPLEPDERAELEAVLPVVRPMLRPEALAVIDRHGVWEETGPAEYATTCVGTAECVFVTYEGPVAVCAIQKAYNAGLVRFPKPISCHLYPIRIEKFRGVEVLNYERIPLCEGGRHCGLRQRVALADFLREPLVRKYGEAWYAQFQEIRAALMGGAPLEASEEAYSDSPPC